MSFRAEIGPRSIGWLIMIALSASCAGTALAQQVRVTDVLTGDQAVGIAWTRALGDTVDPAERLAVPELVFDVPVSLNIPSTGFLNGEPVLGRGAGGMSRGLFEIRVGTDEDFFKVDTSVGSSLSPGLFRVDEVFQVDGVFQFGNNYIGVAFSDAVNAAQATNPANYDFIPALTVDSVSVQENRKTAILYTGSSLPPSTDYTVTVTGITSQSGENLASTGPFSFRTVGGQVLNIRDIHESLETLVGEEVTVTGQVYIPAGANIPVVSGQIIASGYLQDGSGRGLNLFGNPLLSEVDDVGNAVAVTGTLVQNGSTIQITSYSAAVLAGGLPRLGPVVLPLRSALSSRWEGTFIESQGVISQIDRETADLSTLFSTTVFDTSFAGYRVWRADAEDCKHAAADCPDSVFILLRSFSLLDSTWTFEGEEDRFFRDPFDVIPRGTERDRDRQFIAGPFNGFGYFYSVTWFEAVIDATRFPIRVQEFEITSGDTVRAETPTPSESVYSEIIVPTKFARVNTPLLGEVKVVPNPYNPGTPAGKGAFPGPARVEFVNLPAEASINIYSVAGDLVRTLNKEPDQFSDSAVWDLKNADGRDVATGIYLYYITSGTEAIRGKFVIIR